MTRFWARAQRQEDGVALIMSLVIVLLASSLSIAVAGSIMAQVKPSQLSRKLAKTLSAAEAGIDVAQKRIRAGEAAVPARLPCGPFQGDVDGNTTYITEVRYYKKDPTNKTDGWLSAGGQNVDCPAGGLDPATVPGDGWFAVLTSKGAGPAVPGASITSANRTLKAVMKPLAGGGATPTPTPTPTSTSTSTPTPTPTPTPTTTTVIDIGVVENPVGFVAATSGDGWEALFFGDNIYNIFHHYAESRGQMIDCHSKRTGLSCLGYAGGGTYASTVPGPFGTGPDDLVTPFYNVAAVDRPNGRVYIGAGQLGTQNIGVQCLDLVANQSCGFTRLATTDLYNIAPNKAQITGGATIGTKFYVADNRARLFCFDYSTGSPCSSFPSGVSLTTHAADPGFVGTYRFINAWFSSLRSFDDRYVFGLTSNSPFSKMKDLTCFDTQNNSICSGFPKQNVSDAPYVNDVDVQNSSLAPILNSGGQLKGICASRAVDHYSAPYSCFNLNGNSVAQPWPVQNGGAGLIGSDGVMLLGTKMYLAASTEPVAGSKAGRFATYRCWDFATSNWCSGFTSSSSNRSIGPYTMRQDPYMATCIWQVGDNGVFEFFHRDTGQIGTC